MIRLHLSQITILTAIHIHFHTFVMHRTHEKRDILNSKHDLVRLYLITLEASSIAESPSNLKPIHM